MTKSVFAVGDLVKVSSGVYKDAVGVVDDLRDECSTVRIHTDEGNVYAYKDAVVPMIAVQAKTKTKALLKR